MNRRRIAALIGFPLLLCAPALAAAQGPGLREDISFTLKPRHDFSFRSSSHMPDRLRVRIGRLLPLPAHDRGHRLDVLVRRRKLSPWQMETPASVLGPQSRFLLFTAEDRIALGDHLAISAGFQGAKFSNRGVNATMIASEERIRARDWFMPRATVEIAPLSTFDLTLSYRETYHAYGESGHSGPLGLDQEAFRTFTRQMRPETRSRLRLDGVWTPSGQTSLRLTAFAGRLDNQLSFPDRSYVPVNAGSARVAGIAAAMSHRLSSHWRLSLRYDEARVERTDGSRPTERMVSAQGDWTDGPWRGRLRASRNGKPALAITPQKVRRTRIEGEIRYRLPGEDRTSACLSLRLTDPGRLSSTSLLGEQSAGPVLATDQARSLMLGFDLPW